MEGEREEEKRTEGDGSDRKWIETERKGESLEEEKTVRVRRHQWEGQEKHNQKIYHMNKRRERKKNKSSDRP